MYALTQLAPPVGEPITLAEAKQQCRVDITDDDGLIFGLIVAARMQVEQELGRSLVTQTWQQTFDRFPSGFVAPGDFRGYPVGAWRSLAGNLLWPDFATIRCPRAPLQAVLSVSYIDTDGNPQVVDPTTYNIKFADPGVIAPTFGQFWPPARTEIAAVSVSYVAGYGPVTSVAASIAPGSQTVTPASMAGIYVGTILAVDVGQPTREQVAVSAVTGSTFTASFSLNHAPGAAINCVPETLRTAIRMLVGHWYENREAVAAGAMVDVPLAYKALIGANWNGEYS